MRKTINIVTIVTIEDECMPILSIEYVTDKPEEDFTGICKGITDAAGVIFDVPDGHIWARMNVIPNGYYAENGQGLGNDDYPVFINVMMKAEYSEAQLSELSVELTAAFSKVVGRAEKYIHLFFNSGVAGTIAFGGRLQYS
jgi:phenylpyruvate tautomerase PptA (4-oxalocrotonate tautomerase family)